MAADDPATPPEWHWLPWSPGPPAEPAVRDWLRGHLGLAAGEPRFTRDASGRPRLQPPARGDASWSHSGSGLLVAYAPDARIGVDLEAERPRPRALELARRYFTPGEAHWLQAAPEGAQRTTAFLRLWCAKEAVLKAHGRGLAFGLHRLRFAERAGALALVEADPALGPVADWRLHEFAPRPGYRAALAWNPSLE